MTVDRRRPATGGGAGTLAGMATSPVAPAEALSAVRDAELRLAALVGSVDDATVVRSTLLPGWTVGHVVTHLARNADSHVRRTRAAVDGVVVDQYPGGAAQREGEIEAGSHRGAAALRTDLEESSARLLDAGRRPRPRLGQRHPRPLGPGARPGRAARPTVVEVEVHVVDLDLGPTWRDWPDSFVLARLPRCGPERRTGCPTVSGCPTWAPSTPGRSWPGCTADWRGRTSRCSVPGSGRTGADAGATADVVTIAEILGLLIGVVVVATVADRLRIAYPILLVVAGLVVAVLPVAHRGEPRTRPHPVGVPAAAHLRRVARHLGARAVDPLRPILLLAVGLVLATMAAVAVVFHLLGAPVELGRGLRPRCHRSPPDSVAATQIAGKLGLPRRLVTILGGEGLMNDATALTAYQVAVASVATTLSAVDVTARFVYAVVVGVAIGLAVGWAGARLLRRVETPVIENTVLLILPFAAYLPSDKLDASGVLAVVATGLYFGRYRSPFADRRGPAAAAPDLGARRVPADRALVPPRRPRTPARPRDAHGWYLGIARHRVAGRRRHGDRAAPGVDVRGHRPAGWAQPLRRQPGDPGVVARDDRGGLGRHAGRHQPGRRPGPAHRVRLR